jgi:CDP-6-deoxy-D-xylo-4-hexulose-3-dehydrase
VNPVIQLGFNPALVDVDETLNINPDIISSAVNRNTVGIFFAHTLGNPAKAEEILDVSKKHNLFVIEDCCTTLGSRYNDKTCGNFGTASTFSFYPSHGITLGEGGAVCTGSEDLNRIIRSMRDWGKDCVCPAYDESLEGTCGNRFDYKLGDVLYDHRYVYSQIGYNLKPLELQAAIGLEQLKKLNRFNNIRKRNYRLYEEAFKQFKGFLKLPCINEKADPIFFGLPIIIEHDDIDRRDMAIFLNQHKIATRYIFAGNILKQPAYKNVDFKIYGRLDYTDKIMKRAFWMGIHPGINEEMIIYITSVIKEYLGLKGLM